MPSKKFPHIGDKEDLEPIFTPLDAFVKNIDISKVAKRAVFIYDKTLMKMAIKELKLRPNLHISWKYFNAVAYRNRENNIIVLDIGIGAPLTAAVAEDLFAVGVEEIVICGTCGGISESLNVGDIVFATKSLRDEGTSHHYISNLEEFAFPSLSLNVKLKRIAKANKIKYYEGPSWTIDAIYRETEKELLEYKAKGIFTVEMESSALFTVSSIRGKRSAAIFVVSDLLGRKWSGFSINDSHYKQLIEIIRDFADSN